MSASVASHCLVRGVLGRLLLTQGSDGNVAEAGSGELPSWLGEVYPEPGAVVVAPDGVEVHHRLTDPSHDVRLIIDGVDVTTYASFDAERMRYESGAGPVVLEPGEHTAEAQLVVLPPEGTDPAVLETFSWQFRAD